MTWPRRRRRVRLHFANQTPSLEGFLLGRVNGHYIIAQPDLIEGEHQTVELGSREVHIPREQVWFYEVLR